MVPVFPMIIKIRKFYGYAILLVFIISLLLMGCVVRSREQTPFSNNPSEEIQQEENILPICRAISRTAIVDITGASQFYNVGEKQRVIIDLPYLRKELWRIRCTLETTSPYLVIGYLGCKYRIELRWVGKNCKMVIKDDKLFLDFENAYNPKQSGEYPYSIYDQNNVVWRSYLRDYQRIAGDMGILIELPDLTVNEDQHRLVTYDLLIEGLKEMDPSDLYKK